MYTPKIYKDEDPESIRTFLKENSFGILINQTQGKLCATHIPIELEVTVDGKEILQGHISKLNPQAEGFAENDQVLAVFTGPHSYISSSWYDHENVPTWNYIAVHVYGRIKIVDEATTIEQLKNWLINMKRVLRIGFVLKIYQQKQCAKREEYLVLKLKLMKFRLPKKCLKTEMTTIIKTLLRN